MSSYLAQRFNHHVIPWVTVRVAVATAEEGVHSSRTSGVAFRSVITHEPNAAWGNVQMFGDLYVAFGGFFRSSSGVKPVAEKVFKVAGRTVSIQQLLCLNAAR